MTSKERMMRALNKEKPDRVPVTVHQWQQYHLDTYMNGMTPLEACKYWEWMPLFSISRRWGSSGCPTRKSILCRRRSGRSKSILSTAILATKYFTIQSPHRTGKLTYKTGGNLTTTWVTEYLIKKHEDIDLIEKYMPVAKLDKKKVAAEYDAVGDAGILRGFVWGDQAGCWQHACCLMDVQQLILESIDNPDWVHRLMRILMNKKLQFIEESLAGAKFDLIETGGGAGSDTLISPQMHREFCLPYDKKINEALHKHGFLTAYHTCGGMMNILDLIVANGTDASETLAPPRCRWKYHRTGKGAKSFFWKSSYDRGDGPVPYIDVGH